MPKLDLGLPSYDSLFSTEEERQEANSEKVMTIPIDKITDFKEHPFHVTMDEDMAKLIDSIKENDMLMPALVRPKKDGTYEMISGHRRKFALSQLGRKEMNVIIRDLDDDQSIIAMVDSNLQREKILPSEKAFAYKMRLEAMKHQGRVDDMTSDPLGPKYMENNRSNEQLARMVGESVTQIKRYIRLTKLIPKILDMVDRELLAIRSAVEISFLTEAEQYELHAVMELEQCVPNISQANRLKRMSQQKCLDMDMNAGGFYPRADVFNSPNENISGYRKECEKIWRSIRQLISGQIPMGQ